MGLIRKPSEIEGKSTITMLVYGQPGVGKSTLACSAPSCVLFDYDGGVQRINGAHRVPTVQVRSWEDTNAALEELVNELPETKTIVIDTVGKMLDFMSEYIMRQNSRMKKSDGSLSLQGYGLRKQMFVEFIRRVGTLGRNIVFVAHEKEERRGDDTVKRPEIGGSSANDLIKELDLVGYMSMVGNDRTIAFNPTEFFYAKNTCNLAGVIKVPAVVDKAGVPTGANNFIGRILATYMKVQKAQAAEVSRYEKIIDAAKTAAAAAENAKALNAILASLRDPKNQSYNSAMQGERLVALRAKKLGIAYDSIKAEYVTE